MKYLTKRQIIRLNKNTVGEHGGNFVPPNNLLKEEPLDYLVEAVSAEMFGAPLYPEIHHKAGVYLFNIVRNHVFQDGNKRTGLASMEIFLNVNRYYLNQELEKIKVESGKVIPEEGGSRAEILENIVLEVASED